MVDQIVVWGLPAIKLATGMAFIYQLRSQVVHSSHCFSRRGCREPQLTKGSKSHMPDGRAGPGQ